MNCGWKFVIRLPIDSFLFRERHSIILKKLSIVQNYSCFWFPVWYLHVDWSTGHKLLRQFLTCKKSFDENFVPKKCTLEFIDQLLNWQISILSMFFSFFNPQFLSFHREANWSSSLKCAIEEEFSIYLVIYLKKNVWISSIMGAIEI